MKRFIALFLISLTLMQVSIAYEFPLVTDGDKLLDSNGESVYVLADAAWLMGAKLTREEVDSFLDNRALQGFNGVLMDPLLGPGYFQTIGRTHNAYDEEPFLVEGDFTTPNEDYWTHIDYILDAAQQRGFIVFFTPAYLGYACGNEGQCPNFYGMTENDLYSYGQWIGNRYINQPNIIWVHGGDADAASHNTQNNNIEAKVDAIAEGIESTESASIPYSNKLHTAHCNRGYGAMECYDKPWLDIDNIYAACATTATEAEQAYQRSNGIRPVIFYEGRYEGSGYSNSPFQDDADPLCTRSQGYQALLGGAPYAYIYGNEFWGFFTGWQDYTYSYQGVQTLQYLRGIAQTYDVSSLVPDYQNNVLISGKGSGANYAATASNTKLIMSYIPTARTVIVDLNTLSSETSTALWFDVTSGNVQEIGIFTNDHSQTFTSPNDDHEWLLIIESVMQDPCIITELFWTDNILYFGDTARLNINTQNCDGQTLNLQLREMDGNQPTNISGFPILIPANQTSVLWNPVKIPESDSSNNNEFSVIAYPSQNPQNVIVSDLLVVSQRPAPKNPYNIQDGAVTGRAYGISEAGFGGLVLAIAIIAGFLIIGKKKTKD